MNPGARLARAAWVVLAALASAVWAAPAAAAPDFSKSEILVSSESPLESDLVTFTIVLRNTGPDDAGAVDVRAEWPLMGFLVDSVGFDGAEVDHDSRTLTVITPLPAGGERRFTVRVLAPRDSGGDTLTMAIRAAHWASSTEHWDRKSVTIDTRVSTAGVALGGIRVTPAGLATLAVLTFGVVLYLVIRVVASTRGPARGAPGSPAAGAFARLVGPGAAAAAVTVAIGFWTVFGAMAWRDYRSLTSWRETTCTVLGGRLSAQTTTRSGTRTSTSQPRDETNYVPVLGLRYAVDGRETFSSGYDTGSRLGIGGRGGRADELARWSVGATTPCWYDPDDPLDVVVLKGFGGAYLFALFPIPVFLIGLARVRSLVIR